MEKDPCELVWVHWNVRHSAHYTLPYIVHTAMGKCCTKWNTWRCALRGSDALTFDRDSPSRQNICQFLFMLYPSVFFTSRFQCIQFFCIHAIMYSDLGEISIEVSDHMPVLFLNPIPVQIFVLKEIKFRIKTLWNM